MDTEKILKTAEENLKNANRFVTSAGITHFQTLSDFLPPFSDLFPCPLLQRSFSVDKPKSTSIIVMIQKRTTTWFSFQPFNS